MTRDLGPARPEDIGLSATGLAKVDAAVQAQVDAGVIAGAVTLVARHGKVVHTSLLGVKALGLAYVELTTDPDNEASQKVITNNGGYLLERFTKLEAYGATEGLRWRIDL